MMPFHYMVQLATNIIALCMNYCFIHILFTRVTIIMLQANMESIMRNRELTETRMMQVNWLAILVSVICYFLFLLYPCSVILSWDSRSLVYCFIRLFERSWLRLNGGRKKNVQHIMLQKWFVLWLIQPFKQSCLPPVACTLITSVW